ncbi:MAG: hypothetical protein LBP22_06160 [Deltaproteobacteria bacterium]|nr:hypothetical protein [Deltaproteobacteria bacterium]
MIISGPNGPQPPQAEKGPRGQDRPGKASCCVFRKLNAFGGRITLFLISTKLKEGRFPGPAAWVSAPKIG